MWPGFDDAGIRPDNPRHVPRDGGQKLINQLSAATQINADYVCMLSWNDFGESTAIEPGLKEDFFSEPYKGDYYKDLRIVSAHTGVTFAPPVMPPESSIDPLLIPKLQHPPIFVGRAGLQIGAEESNGVQFSIVGHYYEQDVVIADKIADDAMVDFSEDISAFYGQQSILRLKASANGSSGFDWAHWVTAEIQMSGATTFHLIDLATTAEWSSSIGPLVFPTYGANGTAAYGTDVVMMDGQTYAQTLYVHPDWSDAGFTQGTFSNLDIALEENDLSGDDKNSDEPETMGVGMSPDVSWGEPGELYFFTAQYFHPNGANNIHYAEILLSPDGNTTNTIAVRYNVQDNTLQINDPAVNDAYRAAVIVPGDTTQLGHVFGDLYAEQSSVDPDGNQLNMTFAIVPRAKISGMAHQVYLKVEDVQGNVSSWRPHKDFVVNRLITNLYPPTEDSPRFGFADVDEKYTFDPAYNDIDKQYTLDELYFLIADSPPDAFAEDEDVPDGVYLKYKHNGATENGKLYVWDGTEWLGPFDPYSEDPMQVDSPNATVIARWSKPVYADFRTIKVRWRLQFKPHYLGRHKLYSRGTDTMGIDFNGDTGWKYKGYFDVVE